MIKNTDENSIESPTITGRNVNVVPEHDYFLVFKNEESKQSWLKTVPEAKLFTNQHKSEYCLLETLFHNCCLMTLQAPIAEATEQGFEPEKYQSCNC
jgi:hypothetical protein